MPSVVWIVCFVGLFIWMVVIRLRDPQPAGIAEVGRLMFFAGLLAGLLLWK